MYLGENHVEDIHGGYDAVRCPRCNVRLSSHTIGGESYMKYVLPAHQENVSPLEPARGVPEARTVIQHNACE